MDLLRELLELLREDEAKRRPAKTSLVVIGDFIDRGPDSAKVLSTLEWWERKSRRVTVLKGNHEAAFLKSLMGDPASLRMWLKHGGVATLRSFGLDPAQVHSSHEFIELIRRQIPEPTIQWLEQLPISHRIGDYFFCHAGVRPGVPLDEQEPEDLLWITDEFLESRQDHGAVIVHGHHICGSRVEFAGNRICIDTGAYQNGILSAVGLEEHRQWCVSTV